MNCEFSMPQTAVYITANGIPVKLVFDLFRL